MNPWEEISLSDYEKHMALDSVRQLQTMNEMMKVQFEGYPVTTAMVFGIAGGNGLEHVNQEMYKKIYGIDINEEYLAAAKERFSYLKDILECRRIDLTCELDLLPEAELVIANLFIEYVGYETFKKAILKSKAQYVSCIIQINSDEESWISDSPYIHAFDGLDTVHHQIDEKDLTKSMKDIGYSHLKTDEYLLPNGKKLVMIDFKRVTFIEMKLFQVKPDKLNEFEAKIEEMYRNQLKCEGCITLKYFKRFYTIDGIELGDPPRELTKIVKCVKYYSYWEFDTKENYGNAIKIFFDNYNKELQKLLIAPFDINLGYSI